MDIPIIRHSKVKTLTVSILWTLDKYLIASEVLTVRDILRFNVLLCERIGETMHANETILPDIDPNPGDKWPKTKALFTPPIINGTFIIKAKLKIWKEAVIYYDGKGKRNENFFKDGEVV